MWSEIDGTSRRALYYPWIHVRNFEEKGASETRASIPPVMLPRRIHALTGTVVFTRHRRMKFLRRRVSLKWRVAP